MEVLHAQCAVCDPSRLGETCRGLRHTSPCHSLEWSTFKTKTKPMNEPVLCLCSTASTGAAVCTPAPVGDFQSSGRCESGGGGGGGGGGGSGCDPHPTELFIVFLVPVSCPVAVAGAQGLVALLNVHGVQVSPQLEGHRTGPALPGDNLTGFHL